MRPCCGHSAPSARPHWPPLSKHPATLRPHSPQHKRRLGGPQSSAEHVDRSDSIAAEVYSVGCVFDHKEMGERSIDAIRFVQLQLQSLRPRSSRRSVAQFRGKSDGPVGVIAIGHIVGRGRENSVRHSGPAGRFRAPDRFHRVRRKLIPNGATLRERLNRVRDCPAYVQSNFAPLSAVPREASEPARSPVYCQDQPALTFLPAFRRFRKPSGDIDSGSGSSLGRRRALAFSEYRGFSHSRGWESLTPSLGPQHLRRLDGGGCFKPEVDNRLARA